MFAPRRVPPCFITSVAQLKTRMKERVRWPHPSVERTMSVLRPEAGEGEPRAPPVLMDLGRELHLIEDGIEGVFDGQAQTCRKLTRRAACIHEGGRVGKKFETVIIR